ncbi:MAG: 30S ribosomal protein S3 [Candidatus Jordarchaeales archaeon]|nr:30S ribosomal protein S3 [Candidatus Jordarchaeia archaeon]
MSTRAHFIRSSIQRVEIDEFLSKELKKAGYAGVELQKTALGTNVIIYASKPGLVIGRRGRNIQQLTEILEKRFKVENPQISVQEADNPELNARVMANRLATELERGVNYRRASYFILRRIMSAGALGCEIIISGKISSQRAKYRKFRQGVLMKCGEPAEKYVDEAVAYALLKPGVMGVNVRIMRPEVVMPDAVKIKKEKVEATEIEETEVVKDEVQREE